MADVISISTKQLGGGRILDNVTGQYLPIIFGKGSIPSRLRTFTHGTGANQVNKIYATQRTLATVTMDSLDLAGGLTDYKGAAITLTALKWVYISIVSPDGTKVLRVGPQNQAAAGTFGWGSAAVATVYHDFYSDWELYRPITGFTVTATTADIFPIYNPSLTSVTYAIIVAGVG